MRSVLRVASFHLLLGMRVCLSQFERGPQGRAIAGAQLVFESLETGMAQTVVSDPSGVYRILDVQNHSRKPVTRLSASSWITT